jgi:hypothetical protein
MTMTQLRARIRAKGGDVRLHPDCDDRMQMMRGDITVKQWQIWRRTLAKNKAGVLAILREERASRAWEASEKDPSWWKAYPFATNEVLPACTCSTLPYAHNHESPGPRRNVKLDPGESVWDALKTVIQSSRRVKRSWEWKMTSNSWAGN